MSSEVKQGKELMAFDRRSLELTREGLRPVLDIPEVENVLVIYNFGRFNSAAEFGSVLLGREGIELQGTMLQQLLIAYESLSVRFRDQAIAEIRKIDELAAQSAIVAKELLERQHPEEESKPNP